jgi:hypothetical protein
MGGDLGGNRDGPLVRILADHDEHPAFGVVVI